MNLFEKVWDFLFGVLLIGGAPLSGMFVPVILGDSLQWLFGFRVPVAVGMAVAVVSLILALMGFVGAIRIRIRRRALPAWVLVAEVVLGIAWAGFVFAFYGVLTYSAIG